MKKYDCTHFNNDAVASRAQRGLVLQLWDFGIKSLRLGSEAFTPLIFTFSLKKKKKNIFFIFFFSSFFFSLHFSSQSTAYPTICYFFARQRFIHYLNLLNLSFYKITRRGMF